MSSRGELWWALLDERRPVVLLSGGPQPRAMQVVAPATAAERRGFVLLSGDSAMVLGDSAMVPGDSTMVPGEAPQSPADGIEVTVGPIPGWAYDGVVRVALPRDDRTFCTWLATLTPDSLVERFGELAPARLDQLGHALKLARIE